MLKSHTIVILTGGLGLIGWGVDAISGAQWRLEPETITIKLRPLNEAESLAQSKQMYSQTLTKKLGNCS